MPLLPALCHGGQPIPTSKAKENEKGEWEDEIEKLKEQLQALKGSSPWGSLEVDDLCPIRGASIPKGFKIPEFVKYDGKSDPILHLKVYCAKMIIWSRDEHFLICFFHESLGKSALQWYMRLDHTKIHSWRNLAEAFVKQYKFNLNASPTRDQLKWERMKLGEDFKEYAQRWRNLACQVQPPMVESEICSYFIRSLQEPYYGIMLGTYAKEFVDLIEVGERIYTELKGGKLNASHEQEDAEENSVQGEFECEVDDTQCFPCFQQEDERTWPQDFQGQDHFNASFMSMSDLFKYLCDTKQLKPIKASPLQPPYPEWYDPGQSCEFHTGAIGHTIEDCSIFINKVRQGVKKKKIKLPSFPLA